MRRNRDSHGKYKPQQNEAPARRGRRVRTEAEVEEGRLRMEAMRRDLDAAQARMMRQMEVTK